MPRCADIRSILIIGAGPIVIGQACEFDYSGVQACKALRDEGYRIVLVNSNPATIMTDPNIADATYIEPITPEVLEWIIKQERPDAILPTMGGQTALNSALALIELGILEKYHVKLIGVSKETIEKAENRGLFREVVASIGLNVADSRVVHTEEEAVEVQRFFGFPLVIRPSYTLGGSGGGIAYDMEAFHAICQRGFTLSPNHELLIEESLLGWKEFELEVVRDVLGNTIVVCSIENVDAVGIHTGDSITVAPAQTLTDKEYQAMRMAAIAILNAVDVRGGANVQFAIEPRTGRMLVIEMNPRVSRSSALASKATGFPIAKVAAKLAIGYTLAELRHDMLVGGMPMSFEPSIDYVVVKMPRFNFEKFIGVETVLTTQMKSIGEVMALGQNFQQALQKAIVSLEIGMSGLESCMDFSQANVHADLQYALKNPGPERLFYIADACRLGISIKDIYEMTGIDLWFLSQIADLVLVERSEITGQEIMSIAWKKIKQHGFSDKRIAQLLLITEEQVKESRLLAGVRPVYSRVDSCAAEFSVSTAYMYSTYQNFCEAKPDNIKKVVVIGSGANRIGQGIEFDYCCVQAIYALKKAGYQAIMINCNPETVSTDYDVADRLYFEPLTPEYVIAVLQLEQPDGIIVQMGGQTALKLTHTIVQAGFKVLGTSLDMLDLSEDRARFSKFIAQIGLQQPKSRCVSAMEEGIEVTKSLHYPLLIRPSYVLGGRSMKIGHDDLSFCTYLKEALITSEQKPVLIDEFLEDAIEVDVDGICDGTYVLIAGVMQQVEPAGIHSGDSSCCFPAFDLSQATQDRLCSQAAQLARVLDIRGLINIQFAIRDDNIYVLEVNPRASRTMPFIAKACDCQIIQIATRAILGESLRNIMPNLSWLVDGYTMLPQSSKMGAFVKMPVFPFNKFPDIVPVLGPEMKSTGEVMGQGHTFAHAYRRALQASGWIVPSSGSVLMSMQCKDSKDTVTIAQDLISCGFSLIVTSDMTPILEKANITYKKINKITLDNRSFINLIYNDNLVLVLASSPQVSDAHIFSKWHKLAVQHHILFATHISVAKAMIGAIRCIETNDYFSLQTHHMQ